ncbi:hypothetical protein ACOSP7_006800 [Xanthoceras sorbifolium]
MAKVLGTVVSLAGVTTMTLYKGPILKNLGHPLIHFRRNTAIHEHWLKGSVLTAASCITWSICYIMQAIILKRYPARLSLTTWISFLGAVQSAIFTVIVEHKPAADVLWFNCIHSTMVHRKKKGPVFVSMFYPLSTILVAALAYFVLGEKLYLGSIIGAVIVIIGLYLLLWGKETEQEVDSKTEEQSCSTCDEEKCHNTNTESHSSLKASTRAVVMP